MDSQTKERPIIFSTPMVRALIEGRKTQTRRVVNMPIASDAEDVFVWYAGELRKAPNGCAEDGLYEYTPRGLAYLGRCPFGNVGDRLWVREKFGYANSRDYRVIVYAADDSARTILAEGGEDGDPCGTGKRVDGPRRGPVDRWRSPIYMPRWASRLTLTITDRRVERLQDISPEDVNAEGASPAPVMHKREGDAVFAALWDSINGSGAWDANPWVWAITFTTEVRK